MNNGQIISSTIKSIIILILLSSCATNSTFKNEIFYKRDLIMEIDKSEHKGWAILNTVDDFVLRGTFKADTDLVWIKSCARSLEVEKAWKTRTLGTFNKNKAKFKIDLKYPLETDKYCPLEIIGFNKGGKHTFGFIDFKTGEELPAKLICNGAEYLNKGISVCQNYKDLLNEIQFQEPVSYKGNCKIERVDEMAYRFSHKKGYCTVVFKSDEVKNCLGENKKKCHRVTLMAYESVILKQ